MGPLQVFSALLTQTEKLQEILDDGGNLFTNTA